MTLVKNGTALKCATCKRVYPIKDDIPVMLIDEATIEPWSIDVESAIPIADSALVKILLVRLRQIGDVVFTTPAIRALRRRFPDAHLTYIVEPAAAPVVAGNPHLNEVIVAPRAARRCAGCCATSRSAGSCAPSASTSPSTFTADRARRC